MQIGATHDPLLKRSLTHPFRDAFPQPFGIAHGWLAKELLYSRVKCEVLPYPTR
jgi:hypothetical protein